jgi:hypothetical protein
MASGHVNRPNRPNTWLHRPSCKREENPCQRGAVHTWHNSDLPRRLSFGRFGGRSRHQSAVAPAIAIFVSTRLDQVAAFSCAATSVMLGIAALYRAMLIVRNLLWAP